ncbi:hypothetical protein ACQKDD_11930 [Planococcus kocurii]|nr:hypothetical protein [Planococcus sp. ANT_H30]
MPLLKDVKEQGEIRKKQNLIRVMTWVFIAIALVLIWYFTS